MSIAKIKFKRWWHYLIWKNWKWKRKAEAILNRKMKDNEADINKVLRDQIVYGMAYYKFDHEGNMRHIPFEEGWKEETHE